MNLLLSPVFASAIWIGGGGVGLLLVIVIVVLLYIRANPRDILRGAYLGLSLEPMLHIVSGNVSTRRKQIIGPFGYFIMGRLDGGMAVVVFWCPNRRVGMN